MTKFGQRRYTPVLAAGQIVLWGYVVYVPAWQCMYVANLG